MPDAPRLEVTRIADGLWRWTAPHPEWTPEKDRPGGWGRMVAAVYSEPAPGEAGPIVLVDPLAPPSGSAEARKFWSALDRDVDRERREVWIVVANAWHARDAAAFRERYAARHGARALAPPGCAARIGFEPDRCLAAGPLAGTEVEACPIDGLDVGETALFFRRHRALVFADAVIGAGRGRLAVAPEPWAPSDAAALARYRERFRASVASLLALEPEIVLPSHGEPVLARGRDALAAALDAPAWGA